MKRKKINITPIFIFKYASALFLMTILLISCKNSSKLTTSNRWNLSAIYNPSKTYLHPSYKVFHNSQNTSLLYFKVYTNELLFQPTGEGALKSDISLNYTLYSADTGSKAIADSGTFTYTIYKNSTGPFYLNQIPIHAELGNSYRLKLIMHDKLRKNFNISFVEVEKRPELGQQFFNLTSINGEPIFKNVLIGNSAFKVINTNPQSDKLYISYYLNNTPLPKPTFAPGTDEFHYEKPDSLYIIDYDPNRAITLAYEGMYFIQFDTSSSEGVSIAKFYQDFPKINSPGEMIDPLAYITTTAEYNKLLASENKKLAVDNFWIKAGGNTDRGREMIRVYYNRVYFANYYFTNTKPGWKTDRGMVYIVYGPPQNLKKAANSEIWYYYKRKGGEEISFKFNYRPNKYNLNQYLLERSENNTWHWREAVYGWTNGEIFLQD